MLAIAGIQIIFISAKPIICTFLLPLQHYITFSHK